MRSHGNTTTHLITAPDALVVALLTLFCVIVREGFTADKRQSDK